MKRIVTVALLVVTCQQAFARPSIEEERVRIFDASPYFAYRHIGSFVAGMDPMDYFLGRRACLLPDRAKEGWKDARIFTPNESLSTPACWKEEKGMDSADIKFCGIYKTAEDAPPKLLMCDVMHKGAFRSTADLPRAPTPAQF